MTMVMDTFRLLIVQARAVSSRTGRGPTPLIEVVGPTLLEALIFNGADWELSN
mgnify:CR=1 FL=1